MPFDFCKLKANELRHSMIITYNSEYIFYVSECRKDSSYMLSTAYRFREDCIREVLNSKKLNATEQDLKISQTKKKKKTKSNK